MTILFMLLLVALIAGGIFGIGAAIYYRSWELFLLELPIVLIVFGLAYLTYLALNNTLI